MRTDIKFKREVGTMNNEHKTIAKYSSIYLRVALAVAYLSSVASRFGLWGQDNGWGNFENYLAYTAMRNPFLPPSLIPPLSWFVTFAETALAVFLNIGFRIHITAFLSGIMLIFFAIGMAIGEGAKSPFDYSVYTASAASFMLATSHENFLSVDALRKDELAKS